jgi:hypothetical protein
LPSANSCSKAKLQSVHHSSSVTATSALQATLIQCGKLSHADDLIANPLSKQVAKGKYIISPPPLSLFFNGRLYFPVVVDVPQVCTSSKKWLQNMQIG